MLNDGMTTFMPVVPAYGNGGGFVGGNSFLGNDWIALIVLAMIFGWGGFGMGGFGGGMPFMAMPWIGGGYGAGGVNEQYILQTDMATIERKLDDVNNGLCSLGYDQLGQMNGINTNIMQTGYSIRDAIQQDTIANMQNNFGLQRSIYDVQIAGANNTRDLSAQLQACCCDQEKTAMQARFDAQVYNCETLKAIDKLGDRIIDYMSTAETQRLRDENASLKSAAIADAQTKYLDERFRYLDSQINKVAEPAYIVPNPHCGCNCGGGQNYGGFGGYGYPFGTALA